MSPQVPEAVRRAWGDELVAEVVPWLEQMIEEKAVPRDEHQPILSRLEGLERDVTDLKAAIHQLRSEMNERFDRLYHRSETRFDQMHERFDQMNQRFEVRLDQMNQRFEARLDQMNQRFEARLDQMSERMLVQTRWLIGSIALFGTILTILMAIAQFAP